MVQSMENRERQNPGNPASEESASGYLVLRANEEAQKYLDEVRAATASIITRLGRGNGYVEIPFDQLGVTGIENDQAEQALRGALSAVRTEHEMIYGVTLPESRLICVDPSGEKRDELKQRWLVELDRM